MPQQGFSSAVWSLLIKGLTVCCVMWLFDVYTVRYGVLDWGKHQALLRHWGCSRKTQTLKRNESTPENLFHHQVEPVEITNQSINPDLLLHHRVLNVNFPWVQHRRICVIGSKASHMIQQHAVAHIHAALCRFGPAHIPSVHASSMRGHTSSQHGCYSFSPF